MAKTSNLTTKTAVKPQLEPEPAAPKIEEKLAAIDRRLKQQAIEEKRKVAVSHLSAARARVKALLSKTTDQDLRAALEEVRKLERLAGDAPAGDDGAKRVRRSAEELHADAAKLVEFLKDNPGSKSATIQEATGVTVKPPLNVRTFIEKYGPKGTKVKVDGQKAGTTYSVR